MTEIVINDLTPRVQYMASAGQTVFTYNYPIFDGGDLSVYLTLAGHLPDDTVDYLIFNTDYTVQAVGEATGGTITLLTGAANGDIITIERTMPLNRTSDYNDAGSFKAQTVNRDFDRCVMMSQQVNAKLTKRGLLYQHSDSIPSGMNILPKLGGSQFWKSNPSGTGLVAVTLEESAGWSALRSELASETQVSPGAALIGYYDANYGLGPTTVDAFLKALENIITDILPTGLQAPFGGTSAPTGWLLCNGAEVSRALYADLFAVIGTAYGAGNGTTTFNLPDKRGRTSIGAGQGTSLTMRTIGQKLGLQAVALSVANLAPHQHNVSYVPDGTGAGAGGGGVVSARSGAPQATSNGADYGLAGTAHENMQPSEVDNWIIKT